MPLARPLARLALTLAATLASGAWSRADAQAAGASASAPLWVFPVRPAEPAPPAPPDTVQPLHVPASKQRYTAAQVADRFGVPDWFPTKHPTMPAVVARGRRPSVYACAYCHLADGRGRPENAALAGLPAEYIVTQVAEMASGARRPALDGVSPPFDAMKLTADHATSDEVAVAARYFAALRFRAPRTRVIEVDSVPRLRRLSGVYAIDGAGPNEEPLGRRLLEAATDVTRHERHDPDVPYVAYVPRGSLARGRSLATVGAGPAAKPCASCHGADLRGVGAVPPIAGRAPSYILRQLLAFQAGTRAAPASAPMRDVAATMSLDDMIAASAYVGSAKP